MDIIKIDIEDFKGINKLKSLIKFEDCNSISIFSPNSTGKTSLMNALTVLDKDKNKKNKINQKKSKINNEFTFNIQTFESFIDLKKYDFNITIFELITKKLNLQYMNIEDIKKSIKDSIIENIKKNYNNESYEYLINSIPIYNNNKINIKEDIREFFYINLYQKDVIDLFNDKQLENFINFLKEYEQIETNKNNYNREYSEKYCNILNDSKNIIFENSVEVFNEILEKSLKSNDLRSNLYKKYSDCVILKNQAIQNILKKDYKSLFNIKTMKEFNQLKIDLESYFIYKTKEFKELKKNIDEYKKLKEEESKLIHEWLIIFEDYKCLFPNSKINISLIEDKNIYTEKKLPTLKFSIKDSINNEFYDISPNLFSELSISEQRSIYIFSIMLNIHYSSKENNNLFIFDDIIDSFDEINQLSFIYYLKKLEENNIKFIFLTHNYSFYKILSLKLEKNNSKFMFKDNGNINIIDNLQSTDYIFKNWLNNDFILNNKNALIAICPVIREINGLNYNKNEIINQTLTDLLHYKQKDIFVKDYLNCIKEYIKNYNENDYFYYDNYLFSDLIQSVCNDIIINKCNINLDYSLSDLIINKICLSIGIRFLLEKKIVNFLGTESLSNIRSNQTKILINKISENQNIQKIDLYKYDIATSNIIHLNSLNYEVLFYYDIELLKKYYNEIINFNFESYK